MRAIAPLKITVIVPGQLSPQQYHCDRNIRPWVLLLWAIASTNLAIAGSYP